MATAGGPDIERNGLVFGYDTGYGVADNSTPTRHYPGFPVTNMLSYGAAFNSWAKARNSGSSPTVDVKVSKGPFPGTLADRLSLPSDGSYPRIYQNFTPSSTATHTFSIWLKGETEGQGCFVGAFRNSPWSLPSSTTFNITTEWVNYSFNINPQDTSSMQLYIGSHNSHGGKSFLMYGALLQTGGTKTVFTDGTRSSTQSLIDLTRTTNIDVSNVSFDSTGQPTFDGTDDRIVISNPLTVSQPYTILIWCKPDSLGTGASSANRSTPLKGNGHWNPGIWVTQDMIRSHGISHYVDSYIDFNPGEYAQIGMIYNGSNVFNIFNGEILPSYYNPTYSPGTPTQILIGAETTSASSTYWNGSIDSTKMYNRALSAKEIKQNYNSYKNRFDI